MNDGRKEARRKMLENCISDEILLDEEVTIINSGENLINPIHFLTRGKNNKTGLYVGLTKNEKSIYVVIPGNEVSMEMYEEIKDEYLLSPIIEKMIDRLTGSFNQTIKREDISFIEASGEGIDEVLIYLEKFIYTINDNTLDEYLNEFFTYIHLLYNYKLDEQTQTLFVALIPVLKETITDLENTNNMATIYDRVLGLHIDEPSANEDLN